MNTERDPVLAAAGVDRAVVRAWLDAEEQRLQRVLGELRSTGVEDRAQADDLNELAIAGQHPADVASETMEREVDAGLIEDFAAALAELDAARRRVASGTYGRCERCSGPIGADRLEAVPATRWCRPCAEVVERAAARSRTASADRRAVLAGDEFLPDDDVLPGDEAQGVRPAQLDAEDAAVSLRELP